MKLVKSSTSHALRREIGTALVLFFLTILRYLYFGFSYFPQLDDYIQHHNYAAFSTGIWDTLSRIGLLAARPLAGIFDITVWSAFWEHSIWAVILLSACFTAAAMLFYLVFRKHFGISALFLVFLLLNPLNFEGSYWMSASTRVLMGMLFAALCLWFFDRFLDQKGWSNLILALLSGLFAGGFYEQSMTLAIGSVLLLALFRFHEIKAKAAYALLFLFDFIVYFSITSAFATGSVYADRTANFILPISSYYFSEFLPVLLSQLKEVLIEAPFAFMTTGTARGFAVLSENLNVIWIFLAASLLFLLFLFAAAKRKEKEGKPLLGMAFGLLLALAAVSPFFVLDNPWFSLRALVSALPGLALFADRLIALILQKVPQKRTITAGLAVLLAGFFLVGSLSELSDYRATYQYDQKIGKLCADRFSSYKNQTQIAVFNLRPTYLKNQTYFYHEHIHGCTESDWGFTGLLQCFSGMKGNYMVTPLAPGPLYNLYNRFDEFDAYYLLNDQFTLTPLKKEGTLFLRPDGSTAARILADQKGKTMIEIYSEDEKGSLTP